jgi:hypothetical protein
MFKLEDIDFTFQFENHKFKLSELSQEDIDQVETIVEAILHSKVLECRTKATICAFQLYIESLVETDEWISSGNKHH